MRSIASKSIVLFLSVFVFSFLNGCGSNVDEDQANAEKFLEQLEESSGQESKDTSAGGDKSDDPGQPDPGQPDPEPFFLSDFAINDTTADWPNLVQALTEKDIFLSQVAMTYDGNDETFVIINNPFADNSDDHNLIISTKDVTVVQTITQESLGREPGDPPAFIINAEISNDEISAIFASSSFFSDNPSAEVLLQEYDKSGNAIRQALSFTIDKDSIPGFDTEAVSSLINIHSAKIIDDSSAIIAVSQDIQVGFEVEFIRAVIYLTIGEDETVEIVQESSFALPLLAGLNSINILATPEDPEIDTILSTRLHSSTENVTEVLAYDEGNQIWLTATRDDECGAPFTGFCLSKIQGIAAYWILTTESEEISFELNRLKYEEMVCYVLRVQLF